MFLILANVKIVANPYGYLAKSAFSFKIKACVEIHHRYIVDISESRSSLTGG
jgi:hypothetical protein